MFSYISEKNLRQIGGRSVARNTNIELLDTTRGNRTVNLFDQEIHDTQAWFERPRFDEITRLYSARQVVEQRGTIRNEYTVARTAADGFYERLRELFREKKSITTFGPYSPGQAVAMKRLGLEGIYLGGWATSAKGSVTEDPGPDLASYPLSQVPDEAAVIVRALLTADRNQQYLRSRMTEEERQAAPSFDYSPFVVADADTGHGGDPHVRNAIRRFVEVGVPGYHIEDQRPGTKKCGHQGGKVLVASDEQIKRLNAARFQLDIMDVGGIIVARTDAEAATLLEGRSDERDQPFILGATNANLPSYKACYLTMLELFNNVGVTELNGHLLYALSREEAAAAVVWLERVGLRGVLDRKVEDYKKDGRVGVDGLLKEVGSRLVTEWEADAGLETYGEAVAKMLEFRTTEGETFDMSPDEWRRFSGGASFYSARSKAQSLGINPVWDCELAKTPEGYYQVRGGIAYAIAKSVAVAPFADVLWMETKTADLEDAREFARAIHSRFPEKMLAYNLSPSFSWDTTGMTDEQMREFPEELGKLGFVFNFITYGGHQVDGVAAEEFATALQQDGMLALARLQRKIRLVDSPYKTPQTLVGGPRLDGALTASSGRTATTRAMGKDSTQHQHLVQIEVPTKLLEEWLSLWGEHHNLGQNLRVRLRPHRAGGELLELSIRGASEEKLADVVFTTIQDRRGRTILTVRDQNTFDTSLRQKRLMTLMHLFLIHRYKIDLIHYVSPTDDNQFQTASMKKLGIFSQVNNEIGEIIVADVDSEGVASLLAADQGALRGVITKKSA